MIQQLSRRNVIVTAALGQASCGLGGIGVSRNEVQLKIDKNTASNEVGHSIFDFRSSFCVLRRVSSL